MEAMDGAAADDKVTEMEAPHHHAGSPVPASEKSLVTPAPNKPCMDAAESPWTLLGIKKRNANGDAVTAAQSELPASKISEPKAGAKKDSQAPKRAKGENAGEIHAPLRHPLETWEELKARTGVSSRLRFKDMSEEQRFEVMRWHEALKTRCASNKASDAASSQLLRLREQSARARETMSAIQRGAWVSCACAFHFDTRHASR